MKPSPQEAGNGEGFRMNAVCARSFEGCDTPIDGLSHGQRSRYPAADLIGEALQVGFERRGLQSFRDHLVGRILCGCQCNEKHEYETDRVSRFA